MSILALTAVIATLFLLIGLSELFVAHLRLPFSVVLAAFGMVTGASA